jgi:hypothetical protein
VRPSVVGLEHVPNRRLYYYCRSAELSDAAARSLASRHTLGRLRLSIGLERSGSQERVQNPTFVLDRRQTDNFGHGCEMVEWGIRWYARGLSPPRGHRGLGGARSAWEESAQLDELVVAGLAAGIAVVVDDEQVEGGVGIEPVGLRHSVDRPLGRDANAAHESVAAVDRQAGVALGRGDQVPGGDS